MLNIDINRLNTLEKTIHDKILNSIDDNKEMKIIDASEICGVSTSKISKFVKKLGFNTYKEYINFISGKNVIVRTKSNELTRIKNFIDEFDVALVDKFVSILNQYEKIILLGYGPSYICTEYFEYKFRIVSSKMVIALSDEITLEKLLDENTLVIIFSVTGKFKTFDEIFEKAKKVSARVLLVIEEYNNSINLDTSNIFFLTRSFQDEGLLPYEKTRTAFFIFIEEVIHKLYLESKK